VINCISCLHGVVQKVQDKDFTFREVIGCDLLSREVVRLVECNRYQEMKKVGGNECELPLPKFDYGDASSGLPADIMAKVRATSRSSEFPKKRGRGNPNWRKKV